MTLNQAYWKLTHAIWHCKFGSNPDNTDRDPDKGDLLAVEILLDCRRRIYRESLLNI